MLHARHALLGNTLRTMMSTLTVKQPRSPKTAAPAGTKPLWHRSAPSAVRAEEGPALSATAWQAWQKHLKQRTLPKWQVSGSAGHGGPLGWALLASQATPETAAWFALLTEKPKSGEPAAAELAKRVESWLASACATPADEALGLQWVALAGALPELARWLPAELWWDVLQQALETAADAAGIDDQKQPLAAQLLAGELGWTLGCLFPELKPCRQAASEARRQLSHSIVELLDGEGLPAAHNLPNLRPLLACWTRCLARTQAKPQRCFDKPARVQYEWLVRNALRLTRCDGSQAFSTAVDEAAWHPNLLATALELGGDASDRAAAALTVPDKKRRVAKSQKSKSRRQLEPLTPEPATNSEWSAVAVLKPSWSASGHRLFVRYDGSQLQLELDGPAGVVFSGVWSAEVELDGKPLKCTDDWEVVCWTSDDDVDYLELEITLAGGVRIQRQILLAREDLVLLLADSVLGTRSGRLKYRGQLPLGKAIMATPAQETREVLLKGKKRAGQVLPLALPEWRVDPRHGQLVCESEQLVLEQTAEGQHLYCPLAIDLDRSRIRQEVTWRQLTVSEQLQIVARDVAVGFRLQCGAEQWLFYRSLAAPGNRSVLGENLIVDFLAARFESTGDVEALVEIETESH